MAIATKLRNFVMGDPDESDVDSDTPAIAATQTPKSENVNNPYTPSTTSERGAEIDKAQRGVQNIQATTLTWTKTSLATLLILDFQSHSLLTVIEIVAGAMTSAVYIPMAKLLDVWGRAEGFALMVAFTTLGMVLMAVSQNLPTFCAAQGLLDREDSGPFTIGRVWQVLGVALFAGGLTVFLLPFNLATSAPKGWSTDYIIAMIVTGVVVLVLFALHEVYLAPAPFLKQQYLMNQTVIFTCLLDATYQMSYYCWNSYFTSFLQVVSNLKVAEAGYVNSTFSVVSGFLLFCVGYLIRRTGHFKWLLVIAVPLYIFALGLMIHFRQPNQYIGYIVLCEIFISIGGAIITLIVQLAVLASVDHQHVAAVLSLLYISGGVGGAIGNTISGTIWTNTFENGLVRYLPESAQANLTTIYASLPVQLSYPVNSAERIGIQKAYGYAQTRMLSAGVGLMGLSLIWICFIKNLNVNKMKQTKGVVF
ncbi:unnamed protein product [Aureobasidium uvarum]|uniref:MFS general substrate transporter n=1 Tax=Aureobasidium uvarum TaxID=2773716 RepID=A0A9N8PVA4_9PEZI|nr:unnamed protein product [Aureobasidium uvarum]